MSNFIQPSSGIQATTVGTNVSGAANSAANGLAAIVQLVGSGLLASGVFKLYKGERGDGPDFFKSVLAIVAGSLMLALPAVAGYGLSAMFGSSASSALTSSASP